MCAQRRLALASMAIVLIGLSECPLCGEVFRTEDEILAFPHFVLDPKHHLWPYSDTGMHKQCFIEWPQAAEYREFFDQNWNTENPHHPRVISEDGSIVSK